MNSSEIRLFARQSVIYAKSVVENPHEPAAPSRGGRFAEWTTIGVNAIRIKLEKSHRETYDLLSEMPVSFPTSVSRVLPVT